MEFGNGDRPASPIVVAGTTAFASFLLNGIVWLASAWTVGSLPGGSPIFNCILTLVLAWPIAKMAERTSFGIRHQWNIALTCAIFVRIVFWAYYRLYLSPEGPTLLH